MVHKLELSPAVEQELPSRAGVLSRVYHSLYASMGVSISSAGLSAFDRVGTKVAHPLLARTLLADPSVSAILPTAQAPIALGLSEHAPFLVARSGPLMLPPVLLGNSSALAAVTRWGLEAAHLLCSFSLSRDRAIGGLAAALLHGAALLRQLKESDRALVLDLLPPPIAAAFSAAEPSITPELLKWQASRVEALEDVFGVLAEPFDPALLGELSLPTECILVAGGDSRLSIDRETGLNRYGTVPRPRPDAVHFSSSTASSISDYGFMLCDMFRRDLAMAVLRDGISLEALRVQATDAVITQILGLLGLDPSEADVVLAPSGSDTELLAVMSALAAADQPLTNILIAPEETGRAVALAGAGRFFDDIAGSGAAVRKGEEAWPGRSIEVKQVAIRSPDGRPRAIAEIEVKLSQIVRAALAEGRRILLHVLACSKTGLKAPQANCVTEIVAMAPDKIDVVVDACQMRTPFEEIAGWARLGWMTQLSGSKFFTGPPFSGALTLPPSYRKRATEVRALLAAAPGIGRPEDWNEWWRPHLARPTSCAPASIGPVFRWVPAIAEAHLLGTLPLSLCRYAFDRFRARLVARLARSTCLTSIEARDEPADSDDDRPTDLATRSIVCFSVTVRDTLGQRRRTLDAQECQRLFELLNLDLSQHLGPLSPAQRITAAQCAHIGQPVTLCIGDDKRELSVLRLVIGARFFTIVGYAGINAVEAALESEISDAIRAIDKLELAAERWKQIAQLR
jgi:hypothetical protein